MAEEWRWARGYEGMYLVSSNGRVASVPRLNTHGGLLYTSVLPNGYEEVRLSPSADTHVTVYVHRLVAQTFIPNPDNKREVNHIDGNKLNNRVSNLEWSTSSENKLHAYDKQLAKPRRTGMRAVIVDGAYNFDSISEAAEYLHIPRQEITAVCKGRKKTAHGHTFAYKEEPSGTPQE